MDSEKNIGKPFYRAAQDSLSVKLSVAVTMTILTKLHLSVLASSHAGCSRDIERDYCY